MAFAFTAPTVSRGYGYSQPIQSQVGGYQREDFLNNILDAVNKASKKGAKETGKISSIADMLRLASSLAGPYAPLANLAIGGAETYFSDKAMGDMEKSIREQTDKGFLSSELPEYLKDVQSGRKDMLQGNIIKGLMSTGMSAYKQGMFNKTPPVKPGVPFDLEQGLGETGDWMDKFAGASPQKPSVSFDFSQGLGETGDWTLPPRQYAPKGWGHHPEQQFATEGGISKSIFDLLGL